MKKLLLLVAFGAGYVLGAKAGRERYEQIKQTTNKVKNDPLVQQAADVAKDKGPEVASKVGAAAASATGSAASAIKDKATGDKESEKAADDFTDNPFPQGTSTT